jgi:Cu/Ag efflux pump CusA
MPQAVAPQWMLAAKSVEIARENGQRRISVEINVRGRDVGSFVEEAQAAVARDIQLPPGDILQCWQIDGP